jgi:hypothetical protein
MFCDGAGGWMAWGRGDLRKAHKPQKPQKPQTPEWEPEWAYLCSRLLHDDLAVQLVPGLELLSKLLDLRRDHLRQRRLFELVGELLECAVVCEIELVLRRLERAIEEGKSWKRGWERPLQGVRTHALDACAADQPTDDTVWRTFDSIEHTIRKPLDGRALGIHEPVDGRRRRTV